VENFRIVDVCPVCDGRSSQMVWELPRYPFTEQRTNALPQMGTNQTVADQSVLWCPSCTHVYLRKQHNPELLYNDDYQTVASKSMAAVQATGRLLSFAQRAIDFSGVELVFDIGANDGSFLGQVRASGFRGQLAALDPSFSNWDEGIIGFTSFIEDFDFSSLPPSGKTVYFASHVVEHIADPRGFFSLLSQEMSVDDYLVVQFPALEPIVRDLRFDQIHHQHFHYFSWKSVLTVLDHAQLEVVSSGLDWFHYGAGNLVLRKKRLQSNEKIRLLPWGQSALAEYAFLTDDRLLRAINTYRTYQLTVGEVLSAGPYVALGAGLMSPIIFYHLTETWANCKAIYDGEVSKYGTQYIGTPRPISPIPESLEGEVVLISGSVSKSAGRALGKIAMSKSAESLVYPVLNF